MTPKKIKLEVDFIIESNAIEGEFSNKAFTWAWLAWEYANERIPVRLLSSSHILEIHKVLLEEMKPRIAGKFRDCGVTVGGRICPDYTKVKKLLSKWVDTYRNADTEEYIKEAHIEFEKIHPFEDGNGRVGRIIMNWQRQNAGLPILIIHTGIEQAEYYTWFK